jgi:hypothetical protein
VFTVIEPLQLNGFWNLQEMRDKEDFIGPENQ